MQPPDFIIIIIIINIFVKRHRQSYRGAVNESIRQRYRTAVKKMSL